MPQFVPQLRRSLRSGGLVGDLRQALHLEAAAAVVIRHLFGGAETTATFNLVSARSA